MADTIHDFEVLTSPQQEYDDLRHVSREFPCAYLPGKMARHEVYHVLELDGAAYERLLGKGFRRSGNVVYRPRCRGCAECRQIRVMTQRFVPSASMRRVLHRNRDVSVTIADCSYTDEKRDLFERYLEAQHDGSMSSSAEAFRQFLCESPTVSFEVQYHLGDQLLAVSVADRVSGGISSVYMYFDPDLAARSLGTFSILWEIEYCRREKLPYYYLGYLISGCDKMSYKARFQPCEVLVGENRWLGFSARSGA